MTDFSVCNLNQLAPMITAVTTNPVHTDCVFTTIHQFHPTPASMSGIYDPSSQGEGCRFPNPQSTYHTILAVFLCQSTTKTHRQFFSARSSHLSTYWFSRPSVLSRHHTVIPNPKGVSSSHVLWQVWLGASSRLWRRFFHRKLVRFFPHTLELK